MVWYIDIQHNDNPVTQHGLASYVTKFQGQSLEFIQNLLSKKAAGTVNQRRQGASLRGGQNSRKIVVAATREGTIARHGINAPKHAFVTSLRSPEYLVLLKDLHCSLRATNPGVPLIVLAVENELASDIIVDVQLFAAYKEVLSVEFLSAQPRYSKN
ncbi:TPA: hypothetical protein ACH3X1_014715 [Trebouxia sp. C0004]